MSVGVGEYSLSGVGIRESCILVEERLKGSVEENDRALSGSELWRRTAPEKASAEELA